VSAGDPVGVGGRRSVPAVLAALVGTVVLVLATAGCSPSRWKDLEVGECLPAGAGVEGPRVPLPDVVPCAQPHRYEVFAVRELDPPSRAWPGQESLDFNAERLCALAVQDATGLAVTDLPDGVKSVQLAPIRSSWDQGNRTVECLFRHDAETTDTLVRPDRSG
jgi:hypothetical protein